MGKLKEVKDLVQEAVDHGVRSVEEVHLAFARKPFEVIEQVAPNLPLARTIGEAQVKTIGTVYEVIRSVNKAAGNMVDEVLKKLEGTAAASDGAQK